MRLPTIQGVIDRRLLVNFRVDERALSQVLPEPFRPQLINGSGIAGICLIRLKEARPLFVPRFLGVSSENAAHRIAVEWDVGGECRRGVYIPRRDSSSRFSALAGGRLFPGFHHQARFDVREDGESFFVAMNSVDGSARVAVDGAITTSLPDGSVFPSVEAVSDFFESGSLGYSPTKTDGEFDGLELETRGWHVQPLQIASVESSFFEDESVFGEGAVVFDNALVMRSIDHRWHGRETLCCEVAPSAVDAAIQPG